MSNNSRFAHTEISNANQMMKNKSPINELLDRGIPWTPFVVLGFVFSVFVAFAVSFDFGLSATVLVTLGITIILVTVLVFRNPEMGAYLLIISVFSSLSDILTDSGYSSVNRPLLVLIGVSFLVNYILKTGKISKLPSITRTEWALVAYYLVIVLSAFQAPDKSGAFSSILDVTKDIFVAITLLVLLDSRKKWEKGAWTLIITMTVLSLFGVIKMVGETSTTFFGFAQFSEFGQIDESGNLRYGGPIAEANIWGQVLTATIPFVVFRLFNDTQPLRKIFLGIFLVTILLAIVYTGSRGAFVALLAISPFILFSNRIKLPTALLGIILIMSLLLLLPSNLTQRFQTLRIFFDQSDEYALSRDESIVGRRNAILTGLAMFRENPILGVGFGNYGTNYWQYAATLGSESRALFPDSDSDLPQAHSLYVEILSETGFLGIITFATFIILIFAGLFKARKKYLAIRNETNWIAWLDAIAISIFSFLITGIFLHGIFFRYIWMLIGMALAAIAISNDTSSSITLSHRHNPHAR